MLALFRFIIILPLTLEISRSENLVARDHGVNQKRYCNIRGPFMPNHDVIIPKNLTNLPKSSLKECVLVDETVGVNNGVENKLWYFREDLLMNAGHIYWHVSHSHHLLNPEDPLTIDRRGEMFYYFHRNVLARYDAERISNELPPVIPLHFEEGATVRSGYDPHLSGTPTDFRYPKRFKNMKLVNITDTVGILKLLLTDIDNRILIGKNGTLYSLDNKNGIDILGETIEASINSVNAKRYLRRGLHNQGHENIGRLHEYIGESVGNDLVCAPIYNPSTAMMDPVFYQWHKVIDDLFLRHKYFLAPNHPTEGEFPLLWPGVEVQSISVKSLVRQSPANSLRTYFKNLTIEIPLTKDIFFSNVTYDYCIKRLDHDEFTYNITIKKKPYVSSEKAFVRIFMAPRFNFSGQTYTLEKQFLNFFAMDSFVAELDEDITVVSRSSSDSNLLSNWKLENWQNNPPVDYFGECGCGWPSHLLLPRGKTGDGMIFDLFVMVTDATIDVPVQDPLEEDPVCPMRLILCGTKDQKYPDLRPMGFPFNTKPFSISSPEGTRRMVSSLEEYVNLISNSNAVQVVITHDDGAQSEITAQGASLTSSINNAISLCIFYLIFHQ